MGSSEDAGAEDAGAEDAGTDAGERSVCELVELVPRCVDGQQQQGCSWEGGCCRTLGADGLVKLPLTAAGAIELTAQQNKASVYWIRSDDLLQSDFRLRFDVGVGGRDNGTVADGFAVSFLRWLDPAVTALPAVGKSGDGFGLKDMAGVCGSAAYVKTYRAYQDPLGNLQLGAMRVPNGDRVPVPVTAPTFERTAGVRLRLTLEHRRTAEPQLAFEGCNTPDGGASIAAAMVDVTLQRCDGEDCTMLTTMSLRVPRDASLLGISASTGQYFSMQYLERIGYCRAE